MNDWGGTWTDARIAQLRGLWAQDLPTEEIARQMGISKGAVIGKAHRLNLPRRENPVRQMEYTPEQDETIRRLAGLGQSAAQIGAAIGVGEKATRKRMRQLDVYIAITRAPKITLPGLRVVASNPEPLPPPDARKPRGTCCWPLWGNRERPNGRFCDQPAERGAYCSTHGAIAYRGTGSEAAAA